jgi:Zn-finger nucleic acid-binding protein
VSGIEIDTCVRCGGTQRMVARIEALFKAARSRRIKVATGSA